MAAIPGYLLVSVIEGYCSGVDGDESRNAGEDAAIDSETQPHQQDHVIRREPQGLPVGPQGQGEHPDNKGFATTQKALGG